MFSVFCIYIIAVENILSNAMSQSSSSSRVTEGDPKLTNDFMENPTFSLLFLEVNKYSLPLVSEEEQRNTRCLFVSNGVVKVTL